MRYSHVQKVNKQNSCAKKAHKVHHRLGWPACIAAAFRDSVLCRSLWTFVLLIAQENIVSCLKTKIVYIATC